MPSAIICPAHFVLSVSLHHESGSPTVVLAALVV